MKLTNFLNMALFVWEDDCMMDEPISKRKLRREQHKHSEIPPETDSREDSEKTEEYKEYKVGGGKLKKFYVEHYKPLLIITFFILFLALIQIGWQYSTTGDFLNKGVSIKGGLTVTVFSENAFGENVFDLNKLKDEILSRYEKHDLIISPITKAGKQIALVFDIDLTEKEDIENFIIFLEGKFGVKKDDLTIEVTGPSLGKSFFNDTLIALLIAYVFMGIVVFLYFRTIVPSLAVMLCAFSDMVITLAIVNIAGIKLSTAGIVAFLLLIGYSVDTDILLTVRVLKRKEGHYMERIFSAIKTGLTMTITTLGAVTAGLIFSNAAVITQIMTILFIGLIIDIMNTWVQNVGIFRIYMERKVKKEAMLKGNKEVVQ